MTPSRASAPTNTIDSIHVGSCHATRVSECTPREWRCAATRSARARYSPNVRERSASSTASRSSGEAAALASISAHNCGWSSIGRLSGGDRGSTAIHEDLASLIEHPEQDHVMTALVATEVTPVPHLGDQDVAVVTGRGEPSAD